MRLTFYFYAHHHFKKLKGLDLKELDIPLEEDILKEYSMRCKATASFESIKLWYGFYLSFLFFKNSVIVQGVKQRVELGNNSSPTASRVSKLLPQMIYLTNYIFEKRPPPNAIVPSSRL